MLAGLENVCLFKMREDVDEMPLCVYYTDTASSLKKESCMQVSCEKCDDRICKACFRKTSEALLWSLDIICFDDEYTESLFVTLPVSDLGVHNVSKIIEDNIFVKENWRIFEQLTEREKEIIGLLAQGISNPEAALELSVSEDTIKQHRKNIKRKLKLKSLAEMIKFAEIFGI